MPLCERQLWGMGGNSPSLPVLSRVAVWKQEGGFISEAPEGMGQGALVTRLTITVLP